MSTIKKQAIGFGLIFLIFVIFIITFIIYGYHNFNKSLEKTVKYCKKYEKLACDHKLPDKPPVGREDPNEGLFPHMAFIVKKTDSKSTCGGTLISDRFVLTTARCIDTTRTAKVKLGSLTSKASDIGEWFRVSDEYKHEYSTSGGTRHFDLGLLKLSKTVKFSPYVRPICLITDRAVTDEIANNTASGWSADESDPSFQRLRFVDLRINGSDVKSLCDEITEGPHFPPFLTHCSMHTLRKKTACPRTIGGSAQNKLSRDCPNTYVQFGIATEDVFSTQCEGKTEGSVFVIHFKLYLTVAWIADIVWRE